MNNKTSRQLIPQLRFPEFEGEWEERKLGNISKFSKGKGISKNDIDDEGVNECIRYGELYTTYNELIDKVVSRTNVALTDSVVSQKNDVIIPSSGETQLDIATASCVLREGVILGGDLNIIKSDIDGLFLAYLLNNSKKLEIAKLAQGNSVVHLYNKNLSSLLIQTPSNEEQQKIATFLTAIDRRLQNLEKKKALLEQYKKGVMQQIFKREIRFKDDNEESYRTWEKRKLGDFLSIPKKIIPKKIQKEQILTVKLHLKGIFLNDRTDGLKIGATKYIKRRSGQFIYGKQNLFNGAFGIIPKEFDGFLSSGDVPTLDINEKVINPLYFFYFLSRTSYYKNLEKISSGSGSKRIHEETLLKLKSNVPCIEEQTKIANFLSAIDDKINLVGEQIEKTKTYKKGLLQRMFV